jgi:release factor glutamine methyltransferase
MTLADYLRSCKRRLRDAGSASPEPDADLLAAYALGLSREALIRRRHEAFSEEEAALCEALISRRLAGEPVAYIVGRRGFWEHEFAVSPAVLIPRPDSETLIDAALRRLGERRGEALRVLDVATGSGCLLLSLLHELPNASGVGTDLSEAALRMARRNALLIEGGERRARFVRAFWLKGLRGTFDLIVSNPPYVAEADKASLQRDVVAYEPHSALFAGSEGLDAYKALLPGLPPFLAGNGVVILEVGQGQADAVRALGERAGLRFLGAERDLGGIERALAFFRD